MPINELHTDNWPLFTQAPKFLMHTIGNKWALSYGYIFTKG